MKAHELDESGLRRFGHDFARIILIEAIDHDAIEADQRAQLPRRFLTELVEVRRVLHARQHRTHERDRIDRFLRRAGLGFHEDARRRGVDRDVVFRLRMIEPATEDALDGIRPRRQLQPARMLWIASLVKTSRSGWPCLTSAPAVTLTSTTSPLSMFSPSSGNVISLAMLCPL